MARNIEIKAFVDDIESLISKAAALATEGPIDILQDDTFFQCSTGRLKLRAFSDNEGELIFYRRADRQGPKESFYLRSPTPTPAVLRESLTLACGVTGRVRKQRTLFMVGRTRIHLDRVEGLGHFIELEVVLDEGEPAAAGEAVARELMRALDIEPARLIEGAYVDLLTAGGSRSDEPFRYD